MTDAIQSIASLSLNSMVLAYTCECKTKLVFNLSETLKSGGSACPICGTQLPALRNALTAFVEFYKKAGELKEQLTIEIVIPRADPR